MLRMTALDELQKMVLAGRIQVLAEDHTLVSVEGHILVLVAHMMVLEVGRRMA